LGNLLFTNCFKYYKYAYSRKNIIYRTIVCFFQTLFFKTMFEKGLRAQKARSFLLKLHYINIL